MYRGVPYRSGIVKRADEAYVIIYESEGDNMLNKCDLDLQVSLCRRTKSRTTGDKPTYNMCE